MALQATIDRANVALFQLKTMSNTVSTANDSIILDDELHEVYDMDSIQALSQALSALISAKITSFEPSDDGSVKLVVAFDKVHATFFLDTNKRLSKIDVSESWIDTDSILANSLLFSPPDDLRFAITSIQEVQSVKEMFQKDITEFRRTLLIQQRGPMEVTFTFRTGLQCTIGVDVSYGQGPGSVFITHVQHSDINVEQVTLNSLKWRTNAKCFMRLQPLLAFVMEQTI